MLLVLAFALTLLIAVLLSGLAARSVLSTAVLFLGAGAALGSGGLGLIQLEAANPAVEMLTRLALFSVLFTEGMHLRLGELVAAWHLPGRALLLGMPLTLAAIAVLAHLLLGLPWMHALLLGAVLSPTDPVFAAALVGQADVPRRLRHLLNVESGVNDGLALPVVVVLLAVISPEEAHPVGLAGEVLFGIAVGVAIPWAALRIEATRYFRAAPFYRPLNAFAIGLLVLSVAALTHANEFLAAFAAGVTVATVSPEFGKDFEEFGGLVAELLKLSTLVVVGALISPRLLAEIPVAGYAFAGLVLLLVRPFGLGLALIGIRLSWREWFAAVWFGPRGFASMLYALLILRSKIPLADELFHVVALVVAASIVLHSSTDVPVGRWFHDWELTDDRS